MVRIEELLQGLQNGKRRALAKAITLVESHREDQILMAQSLLEQLPVASSTIRVGITGVPGVGKSTFIEALGMMLLERGHKVAVLAVDPSSPSSGGSILGDKTRMQLLSSQQDAFIRPSPTSGTLGGVARRTRETMHLCEAAGYDIILIETVGVGQSEVEVASMVDCFMVLMLAGAGDSLQGIKRGILELADIMVINKADGDNFGAAQRAKSEYQHALHLLKPKFEGLSVPVKLVSSIEKKGIDEVWEEVESFTQHLKENGLFENLRTNQRKNWFVRLTEEMVLRSFWKHPSISNQLHKVEHQLSQATVTPYNAAKSLLNRIEVR